MHPKLLKAYQLADEDRQKLMNAVGGLNQQQMDFKVSADEWSIGQILQHLILGEVATGKLVHRLIKEGTESALAIDKESTLKPVAQMDYTYSSGKAPEFMLPQPAMPVEEIMQQLETSHQRIKETLERYSGDDPDELRSPLPSGSGEVRNLSQWVRFTGLHETHHLKRIKTIMEAEGFPR